MTTVRRPRHVGDIIRVGQLGRVKTVESPYTEAPAGDEGDARSIRRDRRHSTAIRVEIGDRQVDLSDLRARICWRGPRKPAGREQRHAARRGGAMVRQPTPREGDDSPDVAGVPGSSSTTRASPIACSRRRGSRSRHRRRRARTGSGVARRDSCASSSSRCQDGGHAVRDRRRRGMVARRVSISNNTTPNAQMSARLSTILPRACSGAM